MDKITIIGSFWTWKTTIVKALWKRLAHRNKYNIITDIERSCIKEWKGDKEFTQRNILTEQIRQEYKYKDEYQIHDNSCITTLAYSKWILNDEDYQMDFIRTASFLKHYPYTKIFLLVPEFEIEQDWLRSNDKDFQEEIHENILTLLRELKLSFILLTWTVDERVNKLLKYI